MEFKNELPDWNAPGVEPPKSLREEGWKPENKPPADYFNWFFYKTYQSLLDIIENAQHKSEKGQPNGYAGLDPNGKVPSGQLALTKSQVGLGNVDNVKQASKSEFDTHNNDNTRHITSVERIKWNDAPSKQEMTAELNKKVDKVSGKQLSTEDYTSDEKTKLAGIAPNANNYVHPSTHPASMIIQDASRRMVTDAQIADWNSKETTAGAQEKVDVHANSKDNPHNVTKVQVGLGNVENVKQATKQEHDQLAQTVDSTMQDLAETNQTVAAHLADDTQHLQVGERENWNSKADGNIRDDSNKSLRTEVVSSLPTEANKGQIVFLDDMEEPSFKGFTGGEWV